MSLRNFNILKDLPVNKTKLRSQKNYLRVNIPCRPWKARILGYKNTGKMIVVQARISKGGVKPPAPKGGRSPGNLGRVRSRDLPKSKILAQRVCKKYKASHNLLNYYLLSKDGQNYYYEFILYDRTLGIRPKSWIFR